MAGLGSAVRSIIKGLEGQGARVVKKKAGWQIMCPNGEIVTLHATPSDHRALRNARSHIRRAGLTWPLDK